MTDEKEWLIRKGGYYYRPNRSGYTAHPIEAGRYTEDEARAEASVEPWHMKAVHISEVMEMTDKDGTETRHYGPPVSREEFDQLKLDLRTMGKLVRDDLDAINKRLGALEPHDKPQPDSDGWIPYQGHGCPVPEDTRVDVKQKRAGGFDEIHNVTAGPWFRTNCYVISHYRPRPANQEAEWPQDGSLYWFISESSLPLWDKWAAAEEDIERRDFLGIYPTREAAEEAAGKIKRVMDHLRAGKSAVLLRSDAKDWVISL